MVIKSKIGRRRYIVFKVKKGKDITRKDLIYTFNRKLPIDPADLNKSDQNLPESIDQPPKNENSMKSELLKIDDVPLLRHRLKDFNGSMGILLCPHWLKPFAIDIITSISHVGYQNKPVELEPIGTSGTLKKARKKYLH
jgi:RNase P/RNase MRP subunit POP5